MVNVVSFYESILHNVMGLLGMHSKQVEIEPGTIIHFWVPSKQTKNKPNVALIHGFACDGLLTWQFQIIALAKKYSLYIPDLLFFGKSYTSRSDRTTRFQADCMAIGLKKLGVEKCTLVGFSYGGFVGFQMAEHYPDLVGSVVVTGSSLAWTETMNKRTLQSVGCSSLAEVLMPDSVEGVKKLFKAGFYSLPSSMPNFFFKHFLKTMFANRKERAEMLDALVVKDEDVTTHQFKQRIHMIWGKEDQFTVMEVAIKLKEKLGDKTTLHVVKNAGHLALLERPIVFNKCLKEVLSSMTTNHSS